MNFAINYSPEALQLWQDNRIQVDMFKFPPWDELRPLMQLGPGAYIHFENIAGGPYAKEQDLAVLQNWLDSTDTRVVNTHLAVSASDFVDGLPVTPEAVIGKAIEWVDRLGRSFGNENVVVENSSYPIADWDTGLLEEVVDPAVVSEIVGRSGCGLLLDVAHAVRACEGTGRNDVNAYLNAMPVAALRELHVVGILPHKNEFGVREDHFAMTDDDWSVAEWVVGQIRDGHWREPETMAFEYGGIGELFAWRSDADVIAAQVPRLYELARSV
ncbi:MAG: DUF692 family protein [Chloroflexi bacterium]|nr:DUF692 family protein [Chloroflexota bacterium]